MLAKMGSGRNKPNRQTVVPPGAIPALMTSLPLRKIRFLGGKLGDAVEAAAAAALAQASSSSDDSASSLGSAAAIVTTDTFVGPSGYDSDDDDDRGGVLHSDAEDELDEVDHSDVSGASPSKRQRLRDGGSGSLAAAAAGGGASASTDLIPAGLNPNNAALMRRLKQLAGAGELSYASAGSGGGSAPIVITAGHVQSLLPLRALRRLLGDKDGTWVHRIVRGVDDDEVTPR